MPQNKPQEKIDPKLLLAGADSQSSKAAYEQAIGAAAQFVKSLIEAGHLKTMRESSDAFKEGIDSIQPNLKYVLFKLSMAEIERFLLPDNTGDESAATGNEVQK